MRDALPRASFVGLTGTPIELRDANTRAVFGDHIRNKPRREALATRFRDPDDPLQVVLVRGMWLTGFDAPSLHTMYVDKPMLGDETLRAIAGEQVERVRTSGTIDWTLRKDVRAKLRVLVRHILRKHGYPPDKQEQATPTVLEQAEALSEGWVPS